MGDCGMNDALGGLNGGKVDGQQHKAEERSSANPKGQGKENGFYGRESQ